MTTYAVAINRHHKGKAPFPAPEGFWRAYNGQFKNELPTAEALLESIRQGYCFTTWHAGYRKSENFVQGQHVALDFDTKDERSTLDTLERDPFIACYASILYTTPSHTPEAPKGRVVFLLDRPIRDPARYTLLARALVWKYGSADETCKDSCRLFYGSENCDYRLTDSVLNLEAAAEHLVRPYREHLAGIEAARAAEREAARARYGDIEASASVKAAYVERAFRMEAERVEQARPGERHHALLNAAIALGGLCKAAWVPVGCADEGRVYAALLDASGRNGEIDEYGEANVRATIRDGLKYSGGREEPVWKKDEQEQSTDKPGAPTAWRTLYRAYRTSVGMARVAR